jgi:hypothetical protein
MPAPIAPVACEAAWTAAEMRASSRWIHEFTEAEKSQLASALETVRRKGLRVPFGVEDFPLGPLAARLALVRKEVEDGSGVMLLRGLPVDDYGLEAARIVYWGIGAHLGTALAQNPRGELLVEVRDAGGNQYTDPKARGYHTSNRLPFHNDQSDLVGLLCYRRAKSGGLSFIASAAAVHNQILADRPDLLEVLYQPYYCDVRGEEPPGRRPYYVEPRFSIYNGRLFTQHGRTYIDSAQRFPEVPRLTPKQDEAMKLVDSLCGSDRFRLDMDFRRGDIQLLNNRVILHSRTDFEDYAEPDQKRLLLRLWLRTPGYAELPPYFLPRYEDMEYWLNKRGQAQT